MLKLRAEPFYRAATSLSIVSGALDALAKAGVDRHSDHFVDLEARGRTGLAVVDLQEALATLGAEITKKAADRLADDLRSADKKLRYDDFVRRVWEINSRLVDELSAITVLVLSQHETLMFEPLEPLFGVSVDLKFVSASFEIDEAGKCLAVGRPTAAVFHLMRVLEIALRSISRCLQINDPIKPAERNWGFVLGEIRKGIETRWPAATDRQKGDGAFFETVYSLLEAVRNPWRNATMHVEQKYTDDEADHIFYVVRSLLKKLASRMDEAGMPLA